MEYCIMMDHPLDFIKPFSTGPPPLQIEVTSFLGQENSERSCRRALPENVCQFSTVLKLSVHWVDNCQGQRTEICQMHIHIFAL